MKLIFVVVVKFSLLIESLNSLDTRMAKTRKNTSHVPSPAIAPIAARTRHNLKKTANAAEIKKKGVQLTNCKVILTRLTSQQLMSAMMGGLVNIDNKTSSEDAPKYNLRNKPRQNSKIEIKCVPETKAAAISKAVANLISPIDMTVARLWTYLKKNNTSPLVENLCCLAKMRKYSPWPALVLNVKGKNTEVYFFGEGKTGNVQTSEIVPFEKCDVLVKKYLHIAGYIRAVRQLEITLNTPQHLSITKDI